MDLYRQISALRNKTLKIILQRHPTSTLYSALVLPVIASLYLGLGQKFNHADDKYGVGSPGSIDALGDALGKATGGRDTVILVNSGLSGGAIDTVIGTVADAVTSAGRNATRLASESDIGYVCAGSIRATSPCFGAVVFHSSPDEGSGGGGGGYWNYTLRADGALGISFRVDKSDNAAEVYALPLQRAVDAAIAKHDAVSSFPVAGAAHQYPFSALTEDEREAKVRRDYQQTFISFLSVAFLMALIGVCYHMPGLIAAERETGMSQLIDAMMPAAAPWHRQLARLLSHHSAFTLTYLPGWVVAGVVNRILIWTNVSYGVVVPFFVIAGVAMTSMSLLGACFFSKAQLSGIVTALVWLVLGIVAQAVPHPGTATVAILGLLFTPCTFVYFITYIARYEQEALPTDLLRAHPNSPWKLPGIVLWVFFALQILAYPLLAAFLERALHGVTTGTRQNAPPPASSGGLPDAVQIRNMTKIYKPTLLRRLFAFASPPRPEVVAVDSLTLTAKKGQILALLGANGSGKSTTLDAIAGTSNFSSGDIAIDTTGGLGVAPQKNVLWDDLTVEEHLGIFARLKTPSNPATPAQVTDLIRAVGLAKKTKAMAKTLSGGQKRKLQLGMMLIGDSAVCCVDEVSSGIDPLSRRKIWDILLRERGSRTIIMTTHFLDEADLLADNIAILSRGRLRAEGSAAQLKDTFGSGYRVRVLNARHMLGRAPEVDGVERLVSSNTITYVAASAALAASVIRTLEASGVPYKFSGPTIEDVFLNLADEARDHGMKDQVASTGAASEAKLSSSESNGAGDGEKLTAGSGQPLPLLHGRQLGLLPQVAVLLRKRFVIFKTNWVPYVAAFLIPIVAAAIIQLLVRNIAAPGCSPRERSSDTKNTDFTDLLGSPFIVGGPSATFSASSIADVFKPIIPNLAESVANHIKVVDSFDAFKSYIENNRKNVTPVGLWLGQTGSSPTLAYKIDNGVSMFTSTLGQSLLDSLLMNKTIATQYKPFDIAAAPSTGSGLQVIVYFALACSVIPGLFGLYPNSEKRNGVRALQYSSGARAFPVWAAHALFDWSIMIVSMLIAAGVLAGTSSIWYHVGFLFPIFLFYVLAAILITYFVSLIMKSALATYAIASVIQGLGFAIYLIAYFFILLYSDPAETEKSVLIGHWVIAIFFPTGSLVRALMVALNVFSTTCDGFALQSNPAAMKAYGGPLVYLIVQCIFWFSMVVYFESSDGKYKTGKPQYSEDTEDPEVAAEEVRVEGPGEETDGLRVVHLTKAFGKTTAVDNVTFGVGHGEVFALLGPNGAGKSTTISIIRGDIAPSRLGGDVFVENASVTKNRPAARANLGVCPQFDAIDSMTVVEHLQHYARIRGISDVDQQVRAVIRAVGLEAYTGVMAHTLSGGNKRKLSLAIALTGNPSVILLDEPSSGLDAAAKRIMWRTLEAVVPGRSILLTTHSMEEADTLATRAGIMARRMLALGGTEQLCQKFGDTLHVHMVSETAPHSSDEEMQQIQAWVMETFPGARVEQETFHGQMRFSIPASSVQVSGGGNANSRGGSGSGSGSAIGQLLLILEEHREKLGVAHHSVSPTTLNEVFLTIVGKYDVLEEGEATPKKTPWWKRSIF
ncbi:ABC transporter [Cordyceps fumosorosea ARSEF 2679]|uniref:ABC transporter n=1 Tax=Cordyceps fumosorosea (strain ARSEF 2679) TaxID=1081104 RepID=A0A167RLJ6_CORFA|nr:ABC transporter [Cordyceps fumosorosea ARSEF 2679]OAA58715.1 ABC transporter [Cordyceps fumosorosea ARSEF 2679]